MTKLLFPMGLAALVLAQAAPPGSPRPVNQLKTPPGFAVDVFATGVDNARQMALGARGTLFVGSRAAGRVYAVVDRNGDRKGDQVYTIATGLNMPSGVAFRDGALYVAEVSRLTRYDGIESRLDNPPAPVVLNDTLPKETHHGWKFIAFGPDGLLYVPVGAPCNICERTDDQRFASILRMKPDGTALEVFASGVRNSVGFDWHPTTHELWFTDNGRDNLGDDMPPDELNHAPHRGMHFGFPYCHAGEFPDPEFGARRPCAQTEPPARKLGPHVASIGMRFYTGTMFPAEYRNQILIAEHGSWNRSVPIGYRVSLVKLKGSAVESYAPFVEGWLPATGPRWGRPADVLVMPDGSVLVSEDEPGTIYRISYKK